MGKEEFDGEYCHVVDPGSEQRPFKSILGVGLQSTTVGHLMWDVLKGLHTPHTNERFPGFKPVEDKRQEADA